MALRQSLERGRKGIPDALEGLDLAIDGLFEHTDFYKVTPNYIGKGLRALLKLSKSKKLRELGVKL
jgi:hypothetical protein